MRRRDLIKVIAGSAITWPLAARAQPPTLPLVGFLSGRSLASDAHLVKAFRDGLSEADYVDGRNIVIEFRWAEGKSEQLTALAADLVARRPAVIFAGAIDTGIHELKAALASVPVVYAIGGDPVAFGLAASLARPGGNATGMTVMSGALYPKRLALLRELIGQTELVAVLVDPGNAGAALATRDIQAAATDIGQRIILLNTTSETDFGGVFATLAREHAGALLVTDDPVFINGRKKLIVLAALHAVPALYGRRDFPADGGLASYGASPLDQYHQCGLYVGRIVAGVRPAELPFLQPTKFELVINLKTAKALGLKLPQTLLVAADEVIE
jgi:putative tryptophan/tyrosine transport system substrate-binding protein